MGGPYFIKQASSRPILTSTSTTTAIKAGAETFQIRVSTTSAGNITIADSSGGTGISVPIAANVSGEYFAITPGQWYTLVAGMSVTEMT